eukprot:4585521-Amphidinium_carterae.1
MTTASTSSTFTTTSTYTSRSTVTTRTSSTPSLSTGTRTSTSTGSTTSSTSSMSSPSTTVDARGVKPEFAPNQSYVSGSFTVTAACTPAEMRLGCQRGVAESMWVGESRVDCLITSLQQAAGPEFLRRLLAEPFDWSVLFVVEVPDNDTAIVEQRIQNLSSNHREFESSLNRSLLEVVDDKIAFVETFLLRKVSLELVSNGDSPQAILWISYLLGQVQCDKAGRVEDVGSTGNATAVCFGKNDTEVVDGVACQVKRDGLYAVSVPRAVFEDTGIEQYVLVVISPKDPEEELMDADGQAVGAALAVVLGTETGLLYAVSNLQHPINVTFEGLPARNWDCATRETNAGWSRLESDVEAAATSLECATCALSPLS